MFLNYNKQLKLVNGKKILIFILLQRFVLHITVSLPCKDKLKKILKLKGRLREFFGHSFLHISFDFSIYKQGILSFRKFIELFKPNNKFILPLKKKV